MKPLVSILCITFNQVRYVEDTIKGFLEQETLFDCEILIHDDCSTDGTLEILRKYKKQHPDKIRLLEETENQFSKNGVTFIGDMFRLAKGKYIAVCEGDDYWTDPKKLTKQVKIMEKDADVAVCFHPVIVEYEDKSREAALYPEQKYIKKPLLSTLLRRNFIPTNSVLYRARKNYRDLITDTLPNDWYLHLYHARFGKIASLPEPMAVYRRHSGGVWWQSHKNIQKFWINNWKSYARLYEKFFDMYEEENHRKILRNAVEESLMSVSVSAEALHEISAFDFIKYYPDLAGKIIAEQKKQIEKTQQELAEKGIEVEKEKALNQDLDMVQRSLVAEINSLRQSRSWRLTGPLRSVTHYLAKGWRK